jgi:hypothetical protein
MFTRPLKAGDFEAIVARRFPEQEFPADFVKRRAEALELYFPAATEGPLTKAQIERATADVI